VLADKFLVKEDGVYFYIVDKKFWSQPEVTLVAYYAGSDWIMDRA
jgi:hypothetical protein